MVLKCKNCGKPFAYYGTEKREYCEYKCEVEDTGIEEIDEEFSNAKQE